MIRLAYITGEQNCAEPFDRRRRHSSALPDHVHEFDACVPSLDNIPPPFFCRPSPAVASRTTPNRARYVRERCEDDSNPRPTQIDVIDRSVC